jgi:hypothetical protein
MSAWSTAATIAGSVITSIGSVAWLLRYGGDFFLEHTKAKWNRELEAFKDKLNAEQRRYQAQLDRSIFVSRAHFDTEFQAIKEVHQCLSEVKIPFRNLNPLNSATVPFGQESADLVMRLQGANNRFLAKLEEWGVFLEPTQYDELKRCYDAAEHFAEIFPRRGPEMERDYSTTSQHFWDSYRAACQSARDRIAKLAVLPES